MYYFINVWGGRIRTLATRDQKPVNIVIRSYQASRSPLK